MDKKETVARIRAIGVVAVLRGPSPELTVEAVRALVAGGVTGIEITYTTPEAATVVRSLAEEFGDGIVLGMGTLTEPAQAAEAQTAGAQFLVSPHCDDALAAAMRSTGLPLMMGALTPAEVVRSRRLGSDVVKLFPGSLGGPAYLRALRGPLPDIPIMPTGGVSRDNLVDWFRAGAVAVGAGSELCPKELMTTGNFKAVSGIAAEFVAAVKAARQ